MIVAVENGRIGTVGDRRPAVPHLQQAGEALLPQPFQLVGWKAGIERDIGKKSKGAVELGRGRVQHHARHVPAAAAAHRCA